MDDLERPMKVISSTGNLSKTDTYHIHSNIIKKANYRKEVKRNISTVA